MLPGRVQRVASYLEEQLEPQLGKLSCGELIFHAVRLERGHPAILDTARGIYGESIPRGGKGPTRPLCRIHEVKNKIK